jgi:hypothetical protein
MPQEWQNYFGAGEGIVGLGSRMLSLNGTSRRKYGPNIKMVRGVKLISLFTLLEVASQSYTKGRLSKKWGLHEAR